jgi:hypothetical protein
MTGSLHELDAARLDRLIELVLTRDAAQIADYLVPGLGRLMAAGWVFGHAALLVFPASHDDLRSALDQRGFRCSPMVPSTVVRDRLRARCGLPDAPAVHIVHAHKTLPDGTVRELETFLAPAELTEAAVVEREQETESHFAFIPSEPDAGAIRVLRDALLGTGFTPDGGGFNPHENVTTLYFRKPPPRRHIYRLELACPGRYPLLLAEHTGPLPVGVAAAGTR